MTPEAVRNFLLKLYEPALLEDGLALDAVPDDFDFFAEGIVDSLGVLNMISAVEKEFNVSLDMEEMDAEQLTILGSFCRFAAEHSQARAVPATNGSPAPTNGLEPEGVSSELRNFIRRQYSIADDDRDFTDDVNLMSAGYVDPVSLPDLRKFVESKFTIKMEPADHASFPLNTVRELAAFVVRRKKGEI